MRALIDRLRASAATCSTARAASPASPRTHRCTSGTTSTRAQALRLLRSHPAPPPCGPPLYGTYEARRDRRGGKGGGTFCSHCYAAGVQLQPLVRKVGETYSGVSSLQYDKRSRIISTTVSMLYSRQLVHFRSRTCAPAVLAWHIWHSSRLAPAVAWHIWT